MVFVGVDAAAILCRLALQPQDAMSLAICSYSRRVFQSAHRSPVTPARSLKLIWEWMDSQEQLELKFASLVNFIICPSVVCVAETSLRTSFRDEAISSSLLVPVASNLGIGLRRDVMPERSLKKHGYY